MNLGDRLNTYIERNSRKQAEVAAAWLERWKEQSPRAWKDGTVVSQLNRCLKNLAQGVRFFFEDRARGALLLEVLEVPDVDRPELFELAERVMKNTLPSARLIVDATPWSQGPERADALFAEIKRKLLPQGPFPIALVIDEEQFDKLPRSFDDLRDKLLHVRVGNADEGWERVQELAEEQGLVISSRRFPEFERWLATDFDGQHLLFEPHGGLDQFRASGRLPSLAEVSHDLSALVPDDQLQQVRLPHEPLQLRRLMNALRSEVESAQLRMSPVMRQSMARALGITATSTARERTEVTIEALASQLPLPLQKASQAELQEKLTRAGRRQLGPLALRVNDDVHLLNVGAEVAAHAEGRPWVHVHAIEPRPTALTRLLAALEGWTEGDYLTDPFLDHVIGRLDSAGQERNAFWHARAGLMLTQALQPKRVVPVKDWRPALSELLAGDPPAARLRLRVEGGELDFVGSKRPIFAITEGRERQAAAHVRALHQFAPMGELLVSRDEQVLAVTHCGFREMSRYGLAEGWNAPAMLLPRSADVARDAEHWLDLYEGSEFSEGQRPNPFPLQKYSGRMLAGSLEEWGTSPLAIPASLWGEADRELALIWAALNLALAHPQAVRLPDGAVLLRVGGPFFAEVRVMPRTGTPSTGAVQASLLLEVEHKRNYSREHVFELGDIAGLVPTHTVGQSYDFGARLPKQVSLFGPRFWAEITFRGSALFAETPSFFPGAAAVVRSEDEERAAEEERQRQSDDDDDD